MKKPLIRLVLSSLILAPLLTACGGSGGEGGESAADTLTRRQKDSIVSTMPVPGAGVVGKALRASDSIRSRAERHDSLLNR